MARSGGRSRGGHRNRTTGCVWLRFDEWWLLPRVFSHNNNAVLLRFDQHDRTRSIRSRLCLNFSASLQSHQPIQKHGLHTVTEYRTDWATYFDPVTNNLILIVHASLLVTLCVIDLSSSVRVPRQFVVHEYRCRSVSILYLVSGSGRCDWHNIPLVMTEQPNIIICMVSRGDHIK